MRITIDRNFEALADMELLTADDMREVGLQIREQIVRRTMAGQDVNGAPFEPYSDGYAKAKRQALGTDMVNLQVSGGMINDLQIVDVKVEDDTASVTLGWSK